MKKFTALVAAALLAVTLTGCDWGDKTSEPFKDAKRGSSNEGKADTITMPDGFSNVATKCDHGNRIYVIFKNNGSYGSIAVAPNAEGC